MQTRTFTTILLITILTGCVTMRDLAQGEGNLSDRDRNAAIQSSILTVERCTKVRWVGSPDNTISKNKAVLAKRSVITRLFSGENGWYRAESRTEGVTDYVYFNDEDQSFVCGENQWRKLPEATKIFFDDVENPVKRAKGSRS